jgi:hypothetical protein
MFPPPLADRMVHTICDVDSHIPLLAAEPANRHIVSDDMVNPAPITVMVLLAEAEGVCCTA